MATVSHNFSPRPIQGVRKSGEHEAALRQPVSCWADVAVSMLGMDDVGRLFPILLPRENRNTVLLCIYPPPPGSLAISLAAVVDRTLEMSRIPARTNTSTFPTHESYAADSATLSPPRTHFVTSPNSPPLVTPHFPRNSGNSETDRTSPPPLRPTRSTTVVPPKHVHPRRIRNPSFASWPTQSARTGSSLLPPYLTYSDCRF